MIDELTHRPTTLAQGSRHGCWWVCGCGAHGAGHGRPAIGWALHVAQMVCGGQL